MSDTQTTKRLEEMAIEYQTITGRCFWCRDYLGSCLCCDECHRQDCECDECICEIAFTGMNPDCNCNE